MSATPVPRSYVDAVKKLEELMRYVVTDINKLSKNPIPKLDEVLESHRLHLFIQTLSYTELTDPVSARIMLRQIFADQKLNIGSSMEALYRDLRIRSLGKKEVLYRDPTAATNPNRKGQLIDSEAVSGTYIAETSEYKKYKDPILLECQLRGKSHLSIVINALMDFFAHLTIVTDAGLPTQAIGVRTDKLFFDGLFSLAENVYREQKYRVALKYGITKEDIKEPTVEGIVAEVMTTILKQVCDEKFPRTGVGDVFLELYQKLEDINIEKNIGNRNRYIKRVNQLLKSIDVVVKSLPKDFIYVENDRCAYFGSRNGYRKAHRNLAMFCVMVLETLNQVLSNNNA
jgi:hypothetical protein